MKILLVADGRSPITRGWVRTLKQGGFDISLVSTFPCPTRGGKQRSRSFRQLFLPWRAVRRAEKPHPGQAGYGDLSASSVDCSWPAVTGWVRSACKNHAHYYLDVIHREKPDIVHALRIPFEGMLARVTPSDIPFVVSIWGNDLTLHAHGSPLMARETRLTLQRANGLMADAHRDLRLAAEWGLQREKPTLCVPGGGGIDLQALHAASEGKCSVARRLAA